VTTPTVDDIWPTLTENGFSAAVNAKGRLAPSLYRPFPAQTQPAVTEPARSWNTTGREKALVIGVSDYPSPIRALPAVANDVRAMAKVLSSDKGVFSAKNVTSLTDGEATFKKEAFDASPSQWAFLWLDFCHSGGIVPRDLGAGPDGPEVIETVRLYRPPNGKRPTATDDVRADDGVGRANALLVTCQAPLPPGVARSTERSRGRMSATAIRPTSAPSISTGTDCPAWKTRGLP
jgi:Caspase domain